MVEVVVVVVVVVVVEVVVVMVECDRRPLKAIDADKYT